MRAGHHIILSSIIGMMLGLTGCSSGDLPTPMAPVENGWHQSITKQGPYIVQPGDTLYSIAWTYGIDYQAIASINHLKSPYLLKSGQTLYLAPPSKINTSSAAATTKTATSQAVTKSTSSSATKSHTVQATTKTPVAATSSSSSHWQWPVTGTVVQRYDGNNAMSRGIDIRTTPGAKVHAARAGDVVYAGHGIASYGNLIIIKHGTEFLSAYAYNAKNLVHEGDKVKAGQVIATVQGTAAKPNVLHFEIRDRGQPVDPLIYLPK